MSKFFKVVEVPTAEQIDTMLEMQNILNSKINPDWIEKGWDWGDAIIDECMEFKGHLGWKWWKDSSQYQVGITEKNLRQVQLELVDIWHFFLSCGLEEAFYTNFTVAGLASATHDMLAESKKLMEGAALNTELQTDPNWYLNHIIKDAATWEDGIKGACNVSAFYALMCITGLTGQNLVDTYIAKYTLNKFRYDNGYADGSYQKQWLIPEVTMMFQEDNWYLEKIITDRQNLGQPISISTVYNSLQYYYDKMMPGTKH